MSTASPLQLTDLQRFAEKFRAVRGDADRWPLILAEDVAALSAKWESLRGEARENDDPKEGPEFGTWLARIFGHGKTEPFWDRRVTAVRRLKEHCKRTWHHEAAVWAASTHVNGVYRFDDLALKKLDRSVGDEWRRRSRGDRSFPVLDEQAVRRIARKEGLVKEAAKPKAEDSCARCEALEALLAAHGLEAPEE